MVSVKVESYAGSMAEEYPLYFHLLGQKIEIKNIEDRWLTPGCRCFKVLAADGNVYVLEYKENNDSWKLQKTGRPKGRK
jgi:hypothetical protein